MSTNETPHEPSIPDGFITPDEPLIDAESQAVGDSHTDVYSDEPSRMPDGSRSADDVDPRRLVDEPTPSEIRWYYRNGEFAPTAVNKPIDDAHKHGYTVQNDPTNSVADFLDDYDPYRIEARKKARRDGFAFVFWILNDAASVSDSPRNVSGYETFWTLTLDDLDDAMGRLDVATHVDYDYNQLRVLDQGIAVVDDIASPDHGDIVGVIYERNKPTGNQSPTVFIHADRLQHFVENPEVDGPVHEEWYGHVTGHPILGSVFQTMKALEKAKWALGQTVFRYTSPLHVIKTPSGYGIGEDHLESLNDELDGVNAKSGLSLPPEHEMETHGADGEMDPEPYVSSLVEMFCTGTEMTKSVLQGTQTGTVSGSSTDIKNYFNGVERYRQTTAERKMHEAVKMMYGFDQRTIPSFALGFDVNWGPLFKIDRLEATQGMVQLVQSASNAVSGYLLKPNEAREFLESEFAELDVDVDLDELVEEDYDQLDRVNTEWGKQYEEGRSPEDDLEGQGNPLRGNENVNGEGGGNETGESTDPTDPTADGGGVF